MENSIEETIKIIERKIKEAEHYSNVTGLCLTLDEELRNALMNILSNYKKVVKENEELRAKWDKDTHILQNELDNANAKRIELAQQNEKLRHEVAGKLYVIETQAHKEEFYERTFQRLQKENKELKEEKDVDNTTVYLKGIYDERERWDLKVKGNIKNYRKLADEAYKNFQKSNRKDRDSHDAGLYFDGHVSALEEII